MKRKIDVQEYAGQIVAGLQKGVLLNTNGDKFNSMVIGWGNLGRTWGLPTFVVYVREGRYTRAQLDKTGTFTLSVPLGEADPEIFCVCGGLSGRDVDKVREAKLALEPAEANGVPGIRQYPLTLECRVLYAQKQELALLPREIAEKNYPQDVDGTAPRANRDAHVAYIGQIVAAYVIE